MPKALFTDRPKKITISLPMSLYTQIHLLVLDPMRGRSRYGKMSGLIVQLLREWLEEQRKEPEDGSGGTVSERSGEDQEGRGSQFGRVLSSPSSPSTEPSGGRKEFLEDDDTLFPTSRSE